MDARDLLDDPTPLTVRGDDAGATILRAGVPVVHVDRAGRPTVDAAIDCSGLATFRMPGLRAGVIEDGEEVLGRAVEEALVEQAAAAGLDPEAPGTFPRPIRLLLDVASAEDALLALGAERAGGAYRLRGVPVREVEAALRSAGHDPFRFAVDHEAGGLTVTDRPR